MLILLSNKKEFNPGVVLDLSIQCLRIGKRQTQVNKSKRRQL